MRWIKKTFRAYKIVGFPYIFDLYTYGGYKIIFYVKFVWRHTQGTMVDVLTKALALVPAHD